MNPYEAEPPTQRELDEAAEEQSWLESLFNSEPPRCWWPDHDSNCQSCALLAEACTVASVLDGA